MTRRFKKHYTVEEARALLPEVRRWLDRLSTHRRRLQDATERIAPLLAGGADAGGQAVNDTVRDLCQIRRCAREFHRREIQIKDLDRGLIDFPALRDGREVFLCWESGEEDIEHWHELDAGYAGREKLEED
jgi:hypothetical protein